MKRGLATESDYCADFIKELNSPDSDDFSDVNFSVNKLKKLVFDENVSLNKKDDETVITCRLPTKCVYNPSVFTSFSAYEEHYQQRHCNVCYECGKVFPSMRIVELHICEVHDPIMSIRKERGEQIFACFIEECEEKFYSTGERKKHLINNHFYPKEYRFSIVYTGISSKDTSLLFPSKKNLKKRDKKYGQLEKTNSDLSCSDSIMNNHTENEKFMQSSPSGIHFGYGKNK